MSNDIEDIIQQHDIILFDAVCVICNGWARFLIKYDNKIQFKLVSAQSPLGVALLEHYKMSTAHYNTLLVIQANTLYTETTALLKVIQHLGFPLNLMRTGNLLPRIIHDFL